MTFGAAAFTTASVGRLPLRFAGWRSSIRNNNANRMATPTITNPIVRATAIHIRAKEDCIKVDALSIGPWSVKQNSARDRNGEGFSMARLITIEVTG